MWLLADGPMPLSDGKCAFLGNGPSLFVTSFPKNFTFWPHQYQKKLNGKKCDYSAGTEKNLSLPVSDLALILEA